jgi:hypothetical protein
MQISRFRQEKTMLRRPPALRRFALAALLALAAPAPAGTLDQQCRQSLAAASAGMQASGAQVNTVRDKGEESCVAVRRHFLEVVKARAVAALCTTGAERTQDLGRLDGTVEQINGMIAERCGS